jgi:hypothetical protein
MNPALWEALMAERVRDMRASAAPSRRARRSWRARRASARATSGTRGQAGCVQASRLRSV